MPSPPQDNYRGRFAPSPTGAVHYGTLVTAVGSYLQAKKNQGQWFLRIDDLDSTRKIEGADITIIKTLEAFGFEWHGEILYQSTQIAYYREVLAQLVAQSHVFPCLCSRKQLATSGADIYAGSCRHRQLPEKKPHALRLRAGNINIHFKDAVMGLYTQNMATQCGDFIIRRRDGLFAYQLAIVVDDARQNITEIVRGADLLDSTPRQIYLQQLLSYPTPAYCHLPLAVDAAGNKISKSAGGAKIDSAHKQLLLHSVLTFLGQEPPHELARASTDEIWSWAIKHWQINRVPAVKTIQPAPLIDKNTE